MFNSIVQGWIVTFSPARDLRVSIGGCGRAASWACRSRVIDLDAVGSSGARAGGDVTRRVDRRGAGPGRADQRAGRADRGADGGQRGARRQAGPAGASAVAQLGELLESAVER